MKSSMSQLCGAERIFGRFYRGAQGHYAGEGAGLAISMNAISHKQLTHDDSAAMREGLERLLGVAEGRGLRADEEYQLWTDGFLDGDAAVR